MRHVMSLKEEVQMGRSSRVQNSGLFRMAWQDRHGLSMAKDGNENGTTQAASTARNQPLCSAALEGTGGFPLIEQSDAYGECMNPDHADG